LHKAFTARDPRDDADHKPGFRKYRFSFPLSLNLASCSVLGWGWGWGFPASQSSWNRSLQSAPRAATTFVAAPPFVRSLVLPPAVFAPAAVRVRLLLLAFIHKPDRFFEPVGWRHLVPEAGNFEDLDILKPLIHKSVFINTFRIGEIEILFRRD